MARTFSGFPVEWSPEYGGQRVLLMRKNGTSKSFHIRAEDSHIELEYGFFKIEWEMQEVEKTDGKLKRCSCVTRIVSHDAKKDLNSDPGDIDYESFDSNPQDEQTAPIDSGGATCVVLNIRFDSECAADLTNLLYRSSKDETGPFAFHEELKNTTVDIFEVYNKVSPGLGEIFRALNATTPAWKNENESVQDTLHFVQATRVGTDVSSIVWILDDDKKVALFREEIKNRFVDAGIEVVKTEDLSL